MKKEEFDNPFIVMLVFVVVGWLYVGYHIASKRYPDLNSYILVGASIYVVIGYFWAIFIKDANFTRFFPGEEKVTPTLEQRTMLFFGWPIALVCLGFQCFLLCWEKLAESCSGVWATILLHEVEKEETLK